MGSRPTRSLKHEYELYLEEEIETYKESIPRGALLSIGDEAVAVLSEQPQLALTEMLLADEVDRIIFRRLRLLTYQSWRRRRLKTLRELRRPEHWGLHPEDVVVRAINVAGDAHVLVAGAAAEAPSLYFAANGCHVTAIGDEEAVLQRVLSAATAAGLEERVRALHADWSGWAPDAQLHAVIVTTPGLRGLTSTERARVIKMLQGATAEGGVHIVQTVAMERTVPSLRELETRYRGGGWSVSLEHAGSGADVFLARKNVA